MAAPTNSGESESEDTCQEGAKSSCGGLEFLDEEAIFDMPNLLVQMAEGMLLCPPRMELLSTEERAGNQEHDDIVDPAPYLAGDSALLRPLRQNWSEASDWRPRGGIMTMNTLDLQSNNQGFEESNMSFEEESKEVMMTCANFPPSPTYFPLCLPLPTVFFVSTNIKDISLALSSPAKVSYRVWLVYSGQWAAVVRCRCSRLNIGSFTTVEDAISAYEMVVRCSGRFENENISKLPLQLPPTTQQEKPGEDFGLVCSNATGNDEIEAVGTCSEGTGDCVMAVQARLNFGCLGKRKTREKNPGEERRNKKPNGVRIEIPLDNILQIEGMSLKDAANHLEVSNPELKTSCWSYGIQRWPPRNEHKLIRQSLPDETPTVVNQEGFPKLTSHNGPSDQALMTTVDTNSVDKEIPLLQFSLMAQQENPDVGFGNDVAEAIGLGSEGTGEGVMEEAELNFGCSEKKRKRKVNTLGGERGNCITTGFRIAITMEDILKVKEMLLNDAAEHLEVSRSTLKRACREYGIKRWPPRNKHELISQTRPNESLAVENELISQTHPSESPAVEHELINQTCPNESLAVVDLEQIPQLNFDTFLPSTQVSTTIDTKSVKLKARYEGLAITFWLSRPLRKVELEQEVKKRLQLESGTYNINYKDEDDDLVLIACDEDLEECISSSSPLGSRCHELFLKLK